MRLSEGQLVFLSLLTSFVPPLLTVASILLSATFLCAGMFLAFGFSIFFAGTLMAIDELKDILIFKRTNRLRSIVRFVCSACFITAGLLNILSHWPV